VGGPAALPPERRAHLTPHYHVVTEIEPAGVPSRW
jgi:hypothetical protein